MISKDRLKEIILSNREFILNQVDVVIKREAFRLPQDVNKVVVLYGVRRSGKTFILYDLFRKRSEESLYIDFEDERLADFRLEDFEILREAFLELNPHLVNKGRVFLFDEVQNVPGWEKFCRRVAEREKTQVYVSGSSSKIMPEEIHTSLRGRAWSVEITPFSFREYLKAVNAALDRDSLYGQKKVLLKKHFNDYLRWGGFPEIAFSGNEFDKNKIIKEYLGSIFFKDLVERYKIKNISLLDAMIECLFAFFSQKFSLNSFYRQHKDKISFSKDSLFGYYKHFLQSMLIFEVRKFTESPYKRLRNPAKIYLIDSALARKMSSQDSGRILENIVFLELRKRADKISYFEDGCECDFVVNDGEKFLAYQSCYELTPENERREFDGLAACCKQLKLERGVIVTLDQSDEVIKDGVKIEIVPVWKWLLTREDPLQEKSLLESRGALKGVSTNDLIRERRSLRRKDHYKS